MATASVEAERRRAEEAENRQREMAAHPRVLRVRAYLVEKAGLTARSALGVAAEAERLWLRPAPGGGDSFTFRWLQGKGLSRVQAQCVIDRLRRPVYARPVAELAPEWAALSEAERRAAWHRFRDPKKAVPEMRVVWP